MAKKKSKKQNQRKLVIPKRPDRDRRVRQNARIARVLRLLNLVRSRGRWNVKSLSEEMECSERTIYRDCEVLEFAGIHLIYDDSAKCLRPLSDIQFPTLTLTDEEIIGQALATSATRASGLNVGLGASPTTHKLAAVSDDHVRRLLDDATQLVQVLDLKLADHSQHRDIIKTVQLALLQRKQLSGQYDSPYEKKPIRLRIHPYRLCLVKQAWYIVGRPHNEAGAKTYRIARFKSARLLGGAAEIPEEFDLRDYFGNAWSVFRGDQAYDIELLFAPEAARVVTETAWHHTQQVQRHRNGSVTLRFNVDGLNEIASWILGWTGHVKVVAPPLLRKTVIDKLQKGLLMLKGK